MERYNVSYIAQCLRPHAAHHESQCTLCRHLVVSNIFLSGTSGPHCNHQGDVVEAVVTRVLKMGIFADLGPLNIFIPETHIPTDVFHFDGKNYVSSDGQQAIKQQSQIRVRIEHVDMFDDNYLPSNATR